MSILPGVAQDQVVQFIVDHHTRWKANRINLEKLWQECFFRAYSRWPGGAMINQGTGSMERYYHPVIENAVDTVSALLIKAAMPSDSFVSVLARNADSQGQADDANALLRWAHMKNHFKRELRKMVKQAIITGNSPWSVNWTVRKTSIPDQKALGELEQRIIAAQDAGTQPPPMLIPTKPMVTYAGPDFFVTSIYDYIHDPWPEDPDRSLRMRRFFRDPSYIKAMGDENEAGYKVYENTENITPASNAEASDAMKQQEKVALGLSGDYEGKDKVEVIECYGDIPVTFEGDTEPVILYNHVAVIANRTTLLRLEPLPFEHGMMPCGLYQLLPRPGEPYGAGLVERCVGLHDAILERFNQSIVAHAMAVNPMWFYHPDGLFDPDEFEAFPGALFPYTTAKPEPFEVPDKAMDGFHEVALLKAEVSEAFGSITDMNTGGERSATETSLVASNGNARGTDMVEELEQTINTVVRQEISLLQQLLGEAVWVRVTHPLNPTDRPASKRIDRDSIAGEFDIYCIGSSQMMNNTQRLGQLVQITSSLLAIPACQQRLDPVKYGSELFEMAGLKDAASRFWKSDEQVRQEAIDAAAIQNGNVGNPGGQGPSQSVSGQSGMGGVQSLPGVPSLQAQGPHPSLGGGGGGMGNPESLPGRRPMGS